MFKYIKKLLLENIDKLCEILEYFGFCHINCKQNEIRFARNSDGGQNISIKMNCNEAIFIKDFVTGVYCDIFTFIMTEKNVTLYTVLDRCKKTLNIDDNIINKSLTNKELIFGGEIDDVLFGSYSGDKKDIVPYEIYDEDIMNKYDHYCNEMFYKDGITYAAQRFYNVCYDPETNRIVFPWRDINGKILAVKGRLNQYDIPDNVPKYLYLDNGPHSLTLYNISESYIYLTGGFKENPNHNALLNSVYGIKLDENDEETIVVNPDHEIYVFEAEKSVQKLFGWNIHNTVAIGNSTLSDEQCKLLFQLQPKTIYLMLDKNLGLDEIKYNIDKLNEYIITFSGENIFNTQIKYWDWTKNTSLPDKSSPCDGTRKQWEDILNNEIVDASDIENELKNIDEDIMSKSRLETMYRLQKEILK